jgi:predicted nucleic acid-binding OB-fold protein
MTLKSTIKVSQEIELNIETPAFFKAIHSSSAIAIIDEDNIYKVSHFDTYSSIQNGTSESMKSDLSYAVEENRITEDEFLNLYNEARKMTDLNPSLILKNITAKEGSPVQL